MEMKCLNKPTRSLSFIYARIQRIDSPMKPRDIFGLAVRLLGLLFLYLGLRAITPLLDLGAIETAGKSDIINAILPIVFNFAVAWWLLGGGLLLRRAYPETPRILSHARPQPEQEVPASKPAQAEELTDLDRAEQKLAPLVDRPKETHTL